MISRSSWWSTGFGGLCGSSAGFKSEFINGRCGWPYPRSRM